jgi:hypothetical protein
VAYGPEGKERITFSSLNQLTPILSGIFAGPSRGPRRSSMEELLCISSSSFKWMGTRLFGSVHLERSMFLIRLVASRRGVSSDIVALVGISWPFDINAYQANVQLKSIRVSGD